MTKCRAIFSLPLAFALIAASCTRLAPTAPTTATPNPNLKPGDYTQSFTFAGRERSYLIHLPSALGNAPLPLVFVLHGGGGNAEGAAKMSGMSPLADKENFIVVYPDGTGRLEDRVLTWNAGNCCGYALDNQVDDVGFIRALIEELRAVYPIDAQRVYATGISNGGMMAYRLACELSDQFAAIAPVAGALNADCRPAQPVSAVSFHGTADRSVLYDGGAPKQQLDSHPRTDNSVAYAISFWVRQDGCATTPRRVEHGNTVQDEYGDCVNGTGVALYAIKGGGHAWPGGDRLSLLLDQPTQEISATDVMWEFFTRHPKRKN